MEQILTAIGTVVGIAAMMVYRDWRDGKNVFKRNGSYEAQNTLKQILQNQDKLQHHFNHTTTERLETVESGVKIIIEKLDKILIDGVRIRSD